MISPPDREAESAAAPPLLIGGLSTCQNGSPQALAGLEPFAADADYLRLSAGLRASAALRDVTSDPEPGKVVYPFQWTECRYVGGELLWRQGEPLNSPSARFGDDYESWSCPGEPAALLLALLADLNPTAVAGDSYPTRLDVRFDFRVDSETWPIDHRPGCSGVCEPFEAFQGRPGSQKGPTDGPGSTWYSHKRMSDAALALRVYRKDLEDPRAYPLPTLRVELVVQDRKRGGDLFRRRLLESRDAMLRGAAALVELKWGFNPLPGGVPPEAEPKPDREVLDGLDALLNQYPGLIEICDEFGIDLAGLAALRNRSRGEKSKQRDRRRRKQIEAMGDSRAAAAVAVERVLAERGRPAGLTDWDAKAGPRQFRPEPRPVPYSRLGLDEPGPSCDSDAQHLLNGKDAR